MKIYRTGFCALCISFCSAISFNIARAAEPNDALSADSKKHEVAQPAQSSAKIMSELQEGNKRFVEGKLQHPNQDAARKNELVTSQKPTAIVLSCSDSRVPPEIIFDQGMGDLFVVRTAGEVVDSHAIASMEYALEHLGTRLLVVLGHTSCGAIKATLTTPLMQSAGSVNLDKLVSSIRPNILPFMKNASAIASGTMEQPVRANVNGVIREIVKRSKIVRELIDKNELSLAAGIYNLASGKTDFWFFGQPIIIDSIGQDEEEGKATLKKGPKKHIIKKNDTVKEPEVEKAPEIAPTESHSREH